MLADIAPGLEPRQAREPLPPFAEFRESGSSYFTVTAESMAEHLYLRTIMKGCAV